MANEKRLIYANAVQDKIDHEMDVCNSGLIRGELRFLKGCVNTIPTVDAVEVVRCKDCKYYYKSTIGFPDDCLLHCIDVNHDDFCSYGERRAPM